MGDVKRQTDKATDRLKPAGLTFIATWMVHTADHIRRGTDLTSDGVIWAGTLAGMLAAIALTLVFTDHPLAPFATLAVFGALAFGVTATHYAPGWGYFSEPLLADSATDGWAAIAALPEIAAAAWLAWIGLGVVRRQNYQLVSAATTAASTSNTI